MPDWGRIVHKLAAEIEARIDEARLGRSADKRVPRVAPFRGYGTAERIFVLGRVVADPLPALSLRADAWWRNLVSTLRRLESDEVAHARVTVHLHDGSTHELVADDEGYVKQWLPHTPPDTDGQWHSIAFEVAGARSEGSVLVPKPGARFGVISDIDDTVIETDATSIIGTLRSTLLGNAHTRVAFPGVAAFYRALHGGGTGEEANPLFYVSSSPWNLYDILDHVLALHDIPPGPLLLRDWGISETELLPTGHRTHKLEMIRRIMETYPRLDFVLVGDSGQEDPEIYHEIVHTYPERVLAIYIRNVTPLPDRTQIIGRLAEEVLKAGSSMVLTDDSLAAARHAAEKGWISARKLEDIEREVGIDEVARDEPAKPTIVVEEDSTRESP